MSPETHDVLRNLMRELPSAILDAGVLVLFLATLMIWAPVLAGFAR